MKYRNEHWLAPIPSRNRANRKLIKAKEEVQAQVMATHITWKVNPRSNYSGYSTEITVQESDAMFWNGRPFPVSDWLPQD